MLRYTYIATLFLFPGY